MAETPPPVAVTVPVFAPTPGKVAGARYFPLWSIDPGPVRLQVTPGKLEVKICEPPIMTLAELGVILFTGAGVGVGVGAGVLLPPPHPISAIARTQEAIVDKILIIFGDSIIARERNAFKYRPSGGSLNDSRVVHSVTRGTWPEVIRNVKEFARIARIAGIAKIASQLSQHKREFTSQR